MLLLLTLGTFICSHLVEFGAGESSYATAVQMQYDSPISNGAQQQGPIPVHLKEAFEEQGYYLHRLFQQYGNNGTLSYEGLTNLLGSLGLGEVNVLEITHHGLKNKSDGSAPKDSSMPSTDGVKDEHTQLSLPVPESTHKLFETLLSNHAIQDHLHGNCLNVSQLLLNFGLGKASYITPAHFTFLCPALLYQIESGVCLRHGGSDGGHADSTVTFLKALGWSLLALVLISLPSLLALSLVRLMPPARLHVLLCPMAALAVGTLCGDALLHLLPHSRHSEHSELQDSILKGLSVMGGLYLLFIMEGLLGLRNHYWKAKKKERSTVIGQDPEREFTALQDPNLPEESHSTEQHAHHGHSHSLPKQEQAGIGSLVWMVAMGDGIHNLTDGLAIGAAFSQSLTGGLSTTIAVFCHELPHELGDLAVLLGAGWPVGRLVLFSVLSTLLGFIGLLTGSALGHHSAQLSPWVLTITAGVFLYVALANMMPEMLRGDPGPMSPMTRFLLQNVGLLAGGAIMLCIALFEDHIAFNLGDS